LKRKHGSKQVLACVVKGFSRNSNLWHECLRKHDGFESYLIDVTTQPYYEHFVHRDIVYLTPDAEIGEGCSILITFPYTVVSTRSVLVWRILMFVFVSELRFRAAFISALYLVIR